MKIDACSSQEPGPKVLVVDDEPYMVQAWKKMLECHRCEVRTLSDGAEVLEVVESWQPDVTLLDIRLPEVSGIDLLKAIKHWNMDTEVVIMTAYATVETAVETVKPGGTGRPSSLAMTPRLAALPPTIAATSERDVS